jgi:hypothetical protein
MLAKTKIFFLKKPGFANCGSEGSPRWIAMTGKRRSGNARRVIDTGGT